MSKQGRPLKGTEIRITRSIRIEPSYKEAIEAKYGTIQNWFDKKREEEFGQITEATVVKAGEEISEDDF